MQKLGKGLIVAGALFAALATGGWVWAVRTAPAGRAGAGVAEALVRRPVGGIAGTATGIAPDLLLTNSHVVRGCRGREIQVAGLPGPWQVRHEDADADLALLAGPAGSGNATLPLSGSNRTPRGLAVAVLGFAADGSEKGPGVSAGEVLRAGLTIRDAAGRRAGGFVLHDRSGREVQPSWEDGLRYYGAALADRLRWTLEVDAAVAPGSSGGPVLDGAGNLVGLVFAGDPGRRLTAVVPLSDVREFLDAARVAPRIGTRLPTSHPDWQRITEAADAAVYRIRC